MADPAAAAIQSEAHSLNISEDVVAEMDESLAKEVHSVIEEVVQDRSPHRVDDDVDTDGEGGANSPQSEPPNNDDSHQLESERRMNVDDQEMPSEDTNNTILQKPKIEEAAVQEDTPSKDAATCTLSATDSNFVLAVGTETETEHPIPEGSIDSPPPCPGPEPLSGSEPESDTAPREQAEIETPKHQYGDQSQESETQFDCSELQAAIPATPQLQDPVMEDTILEDQQAATRESTLQLGEEGIAAAAAASMKEDSAKASDSARSSRSQTHSGANRMEEALPETAQDVARGEESADCDTEIDHCMEENNAKVDLPGEQSHATPHETPMEDHQADVSPVDEVAPVTDHDGNSCEGVLEQEHAEVDISPVEEVMAEDENDAIVTNVDQLPPVKIGDSDDDKSKIHLEAQSEPQRTGEEAEVVTNVSSQEAEVVQEAVEEEQTPLDAAESGGEVTDLTTETLEKTDMSDKTPAVTADAPETTEELVEMPDASAEMQDDTAEMQDDAAGMPADAADVQDDAHKGEDRGAEMIDETAEMMERTSETVDKIGDTVGLRDGSSEKDSDKKEADADPTPTASEMTEVVAEVTTLGAETTGTFDDVAGEETNGETEERRASQSLFEASVGGIKAAPGEIGEIEATDTMSELADSKKTKNDDIVADGTAIVVAEKIEEQLVDEQEIGDRTEQNQVSAETRPIESVMASGAGITSDEATRGLDAEVKMEEVKIDGMEEANVVEEEEDGEANGSDIAEADTPRDDDFDDHEDQEAKRQKREVYTSTPKASTADASMNRPSYPAATKSVFESTPTPSAVSASALREAPVEASHQKSVFEKPAAPSMADANALSQPSSSPSQRFVFERVGSPSKADVTAASPVTPRGTQRAVYESRPSPSCADSSTSTPLSGARAARSYFVSRTMPSTADVSAWSPARETATGPTVFETKARPSLADARYSDAPTASLGPVVFERPAAPSTAAVRHSDVIEAPSSQKTTFVSQPSPSAADVRAGDNSPSKPGEQ